MIRSLPDIDWRIAATGVALSVAEREYRELLPAVSAVPAAETSQDDLEGARRILADCADVLEAWKPDFVVRTTPSTGIGCDELIATAVAGRVPVLGLQDFPGLGQALGEAEHPVAWRPCDAVATVDEIAADWVTRFKGVVARPIGWCAHDRFRSAAPYADTRRRVRGLAGLSTESAMLVIGASADVPEDQEAAILREVANLVRWDAVGGAGPIRPNYRPHPRRPEDSVERLRQLFDKTMGGVAFELSRDIADAELRACADIVISHASVVNLETMAYASLSRELMRRPLSVYFRPTSGEPLFHGYWGPEAPSTHMPGRGSLIADPSAFAELVGQACGDPELWDSTADTGSRLYGPGTEHDGFRPIFREFLWEWVS
ncbi:hypothetical protein [Nonomuraea sp. NPDC049625]|uniref:hypothetical protein n=1 Tax=Nonomuraea sp. NPDC049625 TaxID=3155775 RepID=UPI003429DB50